MILGGMVISSLFSALISLVKLVADTDSKLPAITYWLMGSLNSATWYTVLFALPFVLGGIALLFSIRWRLNILPMSEDEIQATGSNVNLLRLLTALASTMITAACVSTCGQVGWVGLLIPHICRMALGSDNMVLVPASVSIGAVFMILVDTAARSISPSEIPVSVLTAIIGAPVFIGLLRKTGGWKL
jgi:iron complex transport system permease protein